MTDAMTERETLSSPAPAEVAADGWQALPVQARTVAGIVGALVALPILAVVRETVAYLAEHLELEPWGAEEPVGLLTAARGMGGAGARATCPECDAPAQAQDAFCRRCGAPLRRTEVRSGA